EWGAFLCVYTQRQIYPRSLGMLAHIWCVRVAQGCNGLLVPRAACVCSLVLCDPRGTSGYGCCNSLCVAGDTASPLCLVCAFDGRGIAPKGPIVSVSIRAACYA
ncbi:unnamed protein product, partial [Discosporangium mesarthrocarpum]